MTSLAQKIEAFLFVTGEEVSLRELAKILKTNDSEILKALEELQMEIIDHGLTLVTAHNHVKLTTSPQVSGFLDEFSEKETNDLSKAACETLAIIAYRGPIARHEISIIRGVDSRRIVSQLLRRGLVKRSRSDTEAALFEVSVEFLQQLGLKGREELPEFDKLSNHDNIRRVLNDKG